MDTKDPKVKPVTFSNEAIKELLGITSNVPQARVVPSTLLHPYMVEVARVRSGRRRGFRTLLAELKFRLTLIYLACGSQEAAAKYLGTTTRQFERWLAGEAYPIWRKTAVIDHAYAVALDAIRRIYLRGTIKVSRRGLGLRRRHTTRTQAWSKRCTSNSNKQKNQSPILWHDDETNTHTRDTGGRTEINVQAS